jgi:hypothetical protein
VATGTVAGDGGEGQRTPVEEDPSLNTPALDPKAPRLPGTSQQAKDFLERKDLQVSVQ